MLFERLALLHEGATDAVGLASVGAVGESTLAGSARALSAFGEMRLRKWLI